MTVYDLFKTLNIYTTMLIYNREYNQENKVIFYGKLANIPSKYLSYFVIYMCPISRHELIIDIIER